jgi:CRP/FNR family cyclic AMP-dependent transcriptional regulator
MTFDHDKGATGGRGSVRVLEADPDLGAGLSGPRRAEAARRLVVRTLGARAGTLPDSALRVSGPDGFGLLVLDGVIARELLLSDNVSAELLGAGDLLQDCRADDPSRLLRSRVRWTVIEPARVAVLGSRFAAELSDYPEITAVLVARMVERTHRVAMNHAIAQLTGVDRRALAVFWHLAERWGHVSAAGVEVPLRLPHRILAQIVGARRPTISTALTRLTERGEIARREDGGWTLLGDPVGLPTEEVGRVISLRHRRFASAGVSDQPRTTTPAAAPGVASRLAGTASAWRSATPAATSTTRR